MTISLSTTLKRIEGSSDQNKNQPQKQRQAAAIGFQKNRLLLLNHGRIRISWMPWLRRRTNQFRTARVDKRKFVFFRTTQCH
ncbi:hypothetical protein CEXT_42591 [Caerostris extrusa]|uniref:Uncharacterized protein n=1 Tax=Caerostris extrusa TaxID=172846 RepID=A0AAV4QPD8_CAEEX|nr:hypothetical protein CEXT_42591 [Caerostris extrusa]